MSGRFRVDMAYKYLPIPFEGLFEVYNAAALYMRPSVLAILQAPTVHFCLAALEPLFMPA